MVRHWFRTLFAPTAPCGPLCRAVAEEVETLRLQDGYDRLALRKERSDA